MTEIVEFYYRGSVSVNTKIPVTECTVCAGNDLLSRLDRIKFAHTSHGPYVWFSAERLFAMDDWRGFLNLDLSYSCPSDLSGRYQADKVHRSIRDAIKDLMVMTEDSEDSEDSEDRRRIQYIYRRDGMECRSYVLDVSLRGPLEAPNTELCLLDISRLPTLQKLLWKNLTDDIRECFLQRTVLDKWTIEIIIGYLPLSFDCLVDRFKSK